MGMPKQPLLLLFLITLVSSSQKPTVVEARALSLIPQQSKNYPQNQYSVFQSLFFFTDICLILYVQLQDLQTSSPRSGLFASVAMAKKASAQVHGQSLALSSNVFPGN